MFFYLFFKDNNNSGLPFLIFECVTRTQSAGSKPSTAPIAVRNFKTSSSVQLQHLRTQERDQGRSRIEEDREEDRESRALVHRRRRPTPCHSRHQFLLPRSPSHPVIARRRSGSSSCGGDRRRIPAIPFLSQNNPSARVSRLTI